MRALPRPIDVDSDVSGPSDVIDAEFVDIPATHALSIVPPAISSKRARRITDAYTTRPITPRPVIAIA